MIVEPTSLCRRKFGKKFDLRSFTQPVNSLMVCDCDQPSCQERKIWGKRVNYKRKELGYHAAMSSEWKESIREPTATWYLLC